MALWGHLSWPLPTWRFTFLGRCNFDMSTMMPIGVPQWPTKPVTNKDEPGTDSSGDVTEDEASYADNSDESQDDTDDLPEEFRAQFQEHLTLLGSKPENTRLNAINSAPLFTGSIWRQVQTPGASTSIQYGLLGGDVETLANGNSSRVDPRLFHNVTAPMSVFICGSQGSGKSHSLSCLLENCLVPSAATVLPKPLTGVVFHYDTFTSDTGGSPCEAAYLSSNRNVQVRVLCAPTNVQTIKRIYNRLPNVVVEELLIRESDLNTQRMLDLMVASGKEMPLYLHVVNRVLRDMRIAQQQTNGQFVYKEFKTRMAAAGLAPLQCAPLQQRLDTLESFMPKLHTMTELSGAKLKKKALASGTNWTAKAGQLTIVDLSCPCVTPDMACSLFSICLSLFLEQDSSTGRIVALDEAHKYMSDAESTGSLALTNGLLETIRLQRHLGTRVVISTQEPSISPKLLDLCSVTIVHRFSSPDWLQTLHKHLAGVSTASRILQKATAQGGGERDITTVSVDDENRLAGLFSIIVNLQVGEALVFAPSAAVGLGSDGVDELVRLGSEIVKIRVRTRITADGGRSILAN